MTTTLSPEQQAALDFSKTVLAATYLKEIHQINDGILIKITYPLTGKTYVIAIQEESKRIYTT
jgi:hypothetical protein